MTSTIGDMGPALLHRAGRPRWRHVKFVPMKRDMAAIAHDALRSVVLLNVTPQAAGAAAATLEALGGNALACAAIVVPGDDAGVRADAFAAAAGARVPFVPSLWPAPWGVPPS